MTTYVVQSHVAFGDWWTPTSHNTLLDNVAAFWTNASQYKIPYWSAADAVGAITLANGQILQGTATVPAAAYPPGQPLSIEASKAPMSGVASAGFTQGESSGAATDNLKPILPMLSFLDSANSGHIFKDELRHTPGTLKVRLLCKMAGANTSKSVKFKAYLAALSSGDASASAKVFAASNSATVTCPDAADTLFEVIITLTNADNIAKLDWFNLGIVRDVSVANNATGTVYVLDALLYSE
jgi:hypothetical protein